MTYKIVASPLRGHKITKTVEGVHELHDYLNECHEYGLEVKQVRRVKQPVVQLAQELQIA